MSSVQLCESTSPAIQPRTRATARVQAMVILSFCYRGQNTNTTPAMSNTATPMVITSAAAG